MTQPQVLVPVRPDDPPFMHGLAARTNPEGRYTGDTNPRKWAIPWGDRERCTSHLRDAFHRRDANGDLCQRLILEPEMRSRDGAEWPHPNENGHIGVGCGASWEAIDPFLKQVIIDMTYQRREEDRLAGRPPITVGFYVNAVCNGMPGMIRNHTSTDVINLDRDRDLETFKRNWEPWVECGVLSELNYDAGVHPQWWDKVKNLLNDQMQRYGIYGMTESIKWDDNAGRPPNRYTWAEYQIPMWCISRYILSRDPLGQLVWPWADDPLGSTPMHSDVDRTGHVWIMNSNHTYWGGTSGLLTVDQVRDYRRRGWGVGSWTPWHGADEMVNLPMGPSPDPIPNNGGSGRTPDVDPTPSRGGVDPSRSVPR